MANNYLQFSAAIENLTADELSWWQDEYYRSQEAWNRYCEGIENGGKIDGNNINAPVFSIEIEEGAGSPWIWFNADEFGDPEEVANVAQRFLKEFRPTGCFGITWSETCSKQALGAFGGGAVFVTATDIKWVNTADWLAVHEGARRKTS